MDNDRDNYMKLLCQSVLKNDAELPHLLVNHHRWLKITAEDGTVLEIRPDGGLAHNWWSVDKLRYEDFNHVTPKLMDFEIKKYDPNKDMLYYLILKKA